MSRTASALLLALVWSSSEIQADEAALKPTVVANSIGMKLVQIPAGEFTMGAPPSDKDAKDDERPYHKVKITRPFLLGATTVTNGQFRAFVKESGYKTEAEKNGRAWMSVSATGDIVAGEAGTYWDNIGINRTDAHPVIVVDYDDAVAFCAWLANKEGTKYRLPTEAEWEYACRAGTMTRWSCGDDPDSLVEHGWLWWETFPKYNRVNAPKNGLFVLTAPVARYRPNPWGLYDMHGNVWQWCSDWYGEDYYKKSPANDPSGPTDGDLRIIRGGSWGRGTLCCRSSNRFALSGATSLWVGFRVVCENQPSGADVNELAKLQGVWINFYTEHDGVRDTPDSKHILVGNRYFVINGDKVSEEGTFKIDTSGPIKKIDYACVKGDYEGKTWKGIYQLDGDNYRHFGPWGTDRWESRPTEFKVKTDATTWLRVMKREASR